MQNDDYLLILTILIGSMWLTEKCNAKFIDNDFYNYWNAISRRP